MAETTAAGDPLAASDSPAAAAAPAARAWLRVFALDLLLLAALAAGAYFRFLGQNWDQNTHLHPDERFFTMLLTALAPAASPAEYFDNSVSPLNPFNTQFTHFVYGQFPFIVVRYAAEWVGQTEYGNVHFVGRTLSAFSDLLAILGLYLIGRRLYGQAVGLAAAGLSALAVMQIQQSHFFTPDNFGVLFTVATMYFAVLGAQTRRRPHFLLAGVCFGLALATRINLLPLFGEILVAAAIAHYDEFRAALGAARTRVAARAALSVAAAGLAAFVAFRVAMPMAFGAPGQPTTILSLQPNSQWLDQMRHASAENSGAIDAPPGKQWTNRPALLFPWLNMVLWGMGPPLGLLAWAGFGWAAVRAARGDWRRHALPLTWAGGYFLFMGTRWVMSVRYFLPIYPFLILLGAWALVEVWRWGRNKRAEQAEQPDSRALRALRAFGPPALAALVFLGTFAWAYAFTRIYTRDYTRVAASKWIYRNLPGVVALNVQDEQGEGYLQAPFGGALIYLDEAGPLTLPIDVAAPATITGVTFPHAASLNGGGAPLEAALVAGTDPNAPPLAAGQAVALPAQGYDTRGGSLTIPLPAVVVEAGTPLSLVLRAPAGPLALTGPGMANESWDDPLPVRVAGYPGWDSIYRNLAGAPGGLMHPYNEDDESKRQDLARWLDEADYVFMSSQRAMWSLPRLPLRYPLMIAYYQGLFDGSLGFDLVASFQSNPALGPLRISAVGGRLAWGRDPELPVYNDNPFAAEEAFSVYDHPPVWVFRKRADYDPARTRAQLDAVDLRHVVRYTPREVGREAKSLMLPPDRLRVQRAGGAWSAMFDPQALLNRYEMLGAAVWWLLIAALGWLAFPLAFAALRGLPDAGYPAAKILALLVAAWLAWVFGSLKLLPFTRLTLVLCVLLLAALSAALAWPRRAELRAWLAARRNYVLAVEALALALFVFSLLIRWGNSDLWHPLYGGEKPMDFAYFNAVLKSTTFPPYDPWFAGGYINYYYFGFVIVGVPTKLLGIVPAFAYNLILPTLFSATGMGAFCVAYNLTAGRADAAPQERPPAWLPPRLLPYIAGLAACLLIVVLGNLGQVQVIARAFQQAAGPGAGLQTGLAGLDGLSRAAVGAWRVAVEGAPLGVRTGSWYWDATRIIPPGEGEAGPITEFPFFTFLYADLHAHMIDLPLTLLALAWGLAWIKAAGQAPGPRAWTEWAIPLAAGGLIIGALNPTNTWDYPAYLLLGVLAVGYGAWLGAGRWDGRAMGLAALQIAVLVGLTRLFYLPYTYWYGAGYNAAELWRGSRTDIESYLYIYGLFFFLIVTFLARETRRWLAETSAETLQHSRDWIGALVFAVAAFVLFVGALVWLGYPTAVAIVPLASWAGLLLLRRGAPPERRVVLALVGLGLALTAVVEAVVLRGDISRMNTVFKFYLQVWVLFSVAAGACLAWTLGGLGGWRRAARAMWLGGLAALVAGAASYTVLATRAKVSDRMAERAPRTLDGMRYMRDATYADQGRDLRLGEDYDAIRWMQANVPGSPVIIEANTPEYRWGSRFSIYTGLPGVVGWNWHQRQQRAALPPGVVLDRVRDVELFYSAPDPEEALRIIRQYNIEYVVVGDLEQAYYAPESLAKFEAMVVRGNLRIAYQSAGGTRIYEVVGG